MAAVCDICAKKPGFGNNRPWSRKITKRRFDPNIQRVRALVDGTWGFGATKLMTKDGVAAAAREAVAIAKANRIARDQPVQFAPTEVHKDVTWKSAFTIDPFTIPLEQRAREHGATVLREVYEDHGARGATIIDPSGHRWMLSGPMTGAPVQIKHGDVGYVSVNTPDAARAAAF